MWCKCLTQLSLALRSNAFLLCMCVCKFHLERESLTIGLASKLPTHMWCNNLTQFPLTLCMTCFSGLIQSWLLQVCLLAGVALLCSHAMCWEGCCCCVGVVLRSPCSERRCWGAVPSLSLLGRPLWGVVPRPSESTLSTQGVGFGSGSSWRGYIALFAPMGSSRGG